MCFLSMLHANICVEKLNRDEQAEKTTNPKRQNSSFDYARVKN